MNIDHKLSGKLRQLFINTQQDLTSKKTSVSPAGKIEQPGGDTLQKQAIEYVDLTPGKELLQNLFINQFGIFSFATFLFLLEREYYEGIESKSPLTLIIFTVTLFHSTSDSARYPLSPALVQAIAKTVQYTQRKTDILTQIEENKFAILLPDTNTIGGKSFVSRVQKALLKIANGTVDKALPRFTFGMATISEHCKTLPELLYFAEKSHKKAQQLQKDLVCDQDILSESLADKQEYLEKAIDLKPTRQLVAKLVSAGIFTYPAFLGFLEHEFYRCTRKQVDLLIIVLKIRVRAETFDQDTNLLNDQAFYEVIRRVGSLLTKRDVFAHYSNGNFIIMRSKATLAQVQHLAKRITESIKSNQWLTPECPPDSLRIRPQICIVRPHETSSTLFGFVPAE